MDFKNRKIVPAPDYIGGRYILGYEPYFDKLVLVAFICDESKTVYPAHGYFVPHPHGTLSKRYAKKIGYEFNNN
jgi:hypothetical protein